MPSKLNEIYEKYKVFKINSCDVDSYNALAKTLGKLFIATYTLADAGCKCCSGARIWAALLIAFTLGYIL